MRKFIILFIIAVLFVSTYHMDIKDTKVVPASPHEVHAQEFDLNADYSILMGEAIAAGDFESARHYEELREKKKAYLGIHDDVTFENLLLLSKIIHAEAGSSWLTEEHRQMVASVVINRVNSPEFPNTVYEVVYQKGQYALAGTRYFANLIPSKASVLSALSVLAKGSIIPNDVVFQSNFRQGSGVYKSIYDSKLGTTYFCHSSNRHLYK